MLQDHFSCCRIQGCSGHYLDLRSFLSLARHALFAYILCYIVFRAMFYVLICYSDVSALIQQYSKSFWMESRPAATLFSLKIRGHNSSWKCWTEAVLYSGIVIHTDKHKLSFVWLDLALWHVWTIWNVILPVVRSCRPPTAALHSSTHQTQRRTCQRRCSLAASIWVGPGTWSASCSSLLHKCHVTTQSRIFLQPYSDQQDSFVTRDLCKYKSVLTLLLWHIKYEMEHDIH